MYNFAVNLTTLVKTFLEVNDFDRTVYEVPTWRKTLQYITTAYQWEIHRKFAKLHANYSRFNVKVTSAAAYARSKELMISVPSCCHT